MAGTRANVRAAIYTRISKDTEDTRLGVERQEKDCRRLCADRGWTVVDVYCDIHESMFATLLVLPNRAFAVTGADGRFRIEGVRPGEYTLFAWHRRGPPAKVEHVKVEAGKPTTVPLALSETLLEEPHLDKYGRPYKARGGYEKQEH